MSRIRRAEDKRSLVMWRAFASSNSFSEGCMIFNPEIIAIVIAGGLLCGFLNTVASSGSAVSLPILMSVGLQAVAANATNRLPVLVGAVAATISLARNRAIPWRRALLVAVPVTLGAIIGAVLSERIPDSYLRATIVAAVVIALVLIFTKLKDMLASVATGNVQLGCKPMILLFFVGVWAGFIVLDSATYMLLVLVLASRLTLPEANAIKNVALVTTTAVAMAVFAEHQSVDWGIGGMMALGSILGGLLGARLSVSDQARRWITGLLVMVVAGELVQLSIRYWITLRA
jgi:uncharacterized membrane protein YfcA